MAERKKDKTPPAAKIWLRDNIDALLSSNQFVEKQGLPLKAPGKLLITRLTETNK